MRCAALVSLSLTLLTSFACDSEGYRQREGRVYESCRRATSCGTCTPILGCGWCSHGGSTGLCLADPDQCGGEQFTWTWEPEACSATSGDAGADAAGNADGGAPACHWPASANTFSTADASVSGCLPSVGGSLCPSAQYALTCYGSGVAAPTTPDSALKCNVVSVPTPSNQLFYCCPCATQLP